MDVLTKDLSFAVHLMGKKMEVENVMWKNGQNLLKNLTDMIKYLKVNALMLIVGNLMMQKVPMHALMLIIRFNFVEVLQ